MLGERPLPELADIPALGYVMRCINESMRLYPHPPVLLRRAQAPDVLPGGALLVIPGCGGALELAICAALAALHVSATPHTRAQASCTRLISGGACMRLARTM